jgi:hypothetical protein
MYAQSDPAPYLFYSERHIYKKPHSQTRNLFLTQKLLVTEAHLHLGDFMRQAVYREEFIPLKALRPMQMRITPYLYNQPVHAYCEKKHNTAKVGSIYRYTE